MPRNLFQLERSFCFALLERKEEAMEIHGVAMEERWLNTRPTLGNEKAAKKLTYAYKETANLVKTGIGLNFHHGGQEEARSQGGWSQREWRRASFPLEDVVIGASLVRVTVGG
jgi:hypothetical protein